MHSEEEQEETIVGGCLLVPGTAAVDPTIQEICSSLEHRLAPNGGGLGPDDWQLLARLPKLHASALARVDPAEAAAFGEAVRSRSGWWRRDGHRTKVSDASLERTLVEAVLESAEQPERAAEAKRRLRGPGVFSLRHRRLGSFGYVGRHHSQLVAEIRRLLALAFDGGCQQQQDDDDDGGSVAVVAAVLLLTRQADWQLSLVAADNQAERLAVQNELMLRLGTLWPDGLNQRLNQTLACLKELRELRWCRSSDVENSMSHCFGGGSLTVGKRLGLADWRFEDVRRVVFDGDSTDLYRCDPEACEFAKLARQLLDVPDFEEFRQVHFDACHRLHGMASILASGKSSESERLRYRQEIRQHSGWWGSLEDGPSAFFKDAIANLDYLVLRLARMMKSRKNDGDGDEDDKDAGYEMLQRPGVFVLRHKSRRCWRYVSPPCQDILSELRCLLHRSFDGFSSDGCPGGGDHLDRRLEDSASCVVAPLLLLSTAHEWQLDVLPETATSQIREAYNDLVVRHGALWPRGASLALLIDWQTLPALQASLDAADGRSDEERK